MIPLPPTITSMLVRNRSVTDARLTTEIVRNGGEHKNRTTAGARRGRGVEKIRCLADETLQFVAQKVPIDGKALILVRSAALHFRSEEHTSELQSLMRISYAVFCLKKKNQHYKKSQAKTHPN